MRVQISDMLPSGQVVPNRVHKRKRGQSVAYHARIQKKWTKRFGTTVERVTYVMGGTMFVDRETYRALLDGIPDKG